MSHDHHVDHDDRRTCPCCDDESISLEPTIDRRGFLRTAGVAAAAAAGLAGATASARPLIQVASAATEEKAKEKVAEDFVKLFHESLDGKQREALCFPFDHPLRKTVKNNWHITPQRMGEFLKPDQLELCRHILKGITTEDGYERFQKSMKDDDGGFGQYSCALFGDPARDRYQWVLTGRHVTLRADGNTTDNTAFGGPIFYGHAVTFNEKPDHPGNVWWHQGRVANELFGALDGTQREKALLGDSPPDTQASVGFRGRVKTIPGLAGAEMSRDQKELLQKTLKSMLAMFREDDVKEIMECLKKNGGIDEARIAFYRSGDIGDDGVWDRWRVEGPAFVWYFRGSPHVHTWVNVAHSGPKWV